MALSIHVELITKPVKYDSDIAGYQKAMNSHSEDFLSSTFTTNGLSENQKLDFWAGTICQTLLKLECEVDTKKQFFGEIKHQHFAGIDAVEMLTVAQKFKRTSTHLSQIDKDSMVLSIPLTQTSSKQINTTSLPAIKGDVSLFDGSREQNLFVRNDKIHALVIQIPKVYFNPYLPDISSYDSSVISAGTVIGGLVSQFIQNMVTSVGCMQPHERIAARDLLVSMLATTLTTSKKNDCSGQDLRVGLVDAIKKFIIDNCGNPQLNPSYIARHFRVSVRYVYKLFEMEPVSLSNFIMEGRLANGAKLLLDCPELQIAQIAFRSGFNDASHFSKVFKMRNGASPKDYRSIYR